MPTAEITSVEYTYLRISQKHIGSRRARFTQVGALGTTFLWGPLFPTPIHSSGSNGKKYIKMYFK